MQSRICISLFLLTLLMCCTAALADITLTLDKPEYLVGDIVHAAAHNNGPGVELFLSDPFFLIYNEDLNECVFGCVGLPVVTPFEVGETVTLDWDTGYFPDIPGNYSVSIAVIGGPSVSYVLMAPVTTEAHSWGVLKALFR